MKDFEDFLNETNMQRKQMIDTAIEKINGTLTSQDIVDTTHNARISLSIFRNEMAIYHQWLMEQIMELYPTAGKSRAETDEE